MLICNSNSSSSNNNHRIEMKLLKSLIKLRILIIISHIIIFKIFVKNSMRLKDNQNKIINNNKKLLRVILGE